MGTIVSYINPVNTGRTDDPDPVTGLTSRDKYLVQHSWARVMKNPIETGVELFSLLFKKHPHYVQLFPFRDVPSNEFNKNPIFKAHANSVVFALAAIVDSVNDTELLIQILLKTGNSHQSKNVTANGFKNLKDVVIELFKRMMKPIEVEAWKKTLGVAFGLILQGLADIDRS